MIITNIEKSKGLFSKSVNMSVFVVIIFKLMTKDDLKKDANTLIIYFQDIFLVVKSSLLL